MLSGITFVIPAYNAQRTIGRAIQSLAEQTRANWAAIVVDDGSADSTAEIAAAWSRRDRRVRLVSQANAGVSAARNAGLTLAEGEFLSFLDADDTLHPAYAQRMLEVIGRAEGADAVCCGSVRLSSRGRPIERSVAPRLDLNPGDLCRSYAPAPLNALLVRRRSALGVGGFDPNLQGYEDWDFWRKLVASGIRFAVQPAVLAHYWCNAGSLTSNGSQMLDGFRAVVSRGLAAAGSNEPGGPSVGAPSEQAEFDALFWNVGLAIGQNRDPLPLLQGWTSPEDLPVYKHGVAQAFLRGLALGRECGIEHFIGQWPSLAPAINAFLMVIETRMARPGAAYGLVKALEREVLRGGFSGSATLTRSVGVRIGWRVLARGLEADPSIDSVVVRLPGVRKVVEVPIWRTMTASTLRQALLSEGLQRLIKESRWERLTASPILRNAERLARRAVRLGRQLRGRHSADARPLLAVSLPSDLARSPADAIIDEERRLVEQAPPDAVAVAPSERKAEPFNLSGDALVAAWEEFYATSDPWNYGSAYEQLKYTRTLAMIPEGPIGRALELGCSEGRFTAMLAARVEHLRAVDIAQTALTRAAERCRAYSNVEFRAVDVFSSEIEGTWDLITASEMIYHIEDPGALPGFIVRLRDALAPGGFLIQTHAFDVSVTPGRTGFDWAGPIDGEVIAATMRSTAGLQHVRGLTTDLYRIDLFRRSVEPAAPTIETVPLGCELDPAVESAVIWNGAIARRADLERARAYSVPVLMYHRVAEDGPAALAPHRVTPRAFAQQMRFLRRRGFRSLAPDEWQSRHFGGSLIGRPVMITFDDAYLDFADVAWPILRRSGFGAHVFVPTDLLGGFAVWDAASGPPAPLMDWPTIARLATEGVTFGSHLASHTRADYLDSTALLREATRSRAALEAVLQRPVTTVAPPFGVSDQRTRLVLAKAGYRQSFSDFGDNAPVFGMSFATPRIDVEGADTLEDFARKVGMAEHPPDRGDLL